MEEKYKRIARLLFGSKKCTALTGAGISAESGISTFRSKGGLWEKYDPAVYASLDTFNRDPSKYWTIRGDFIRNYDSFEPNPAHTALAELEKMGVLYSVITQNIDGLHTKAGSKKVIEVHGNLRQTFCVKCKKEYIAPNIPDGTPPYCSECGGVLKPNTVLFGEQLPAQALSQAQQESISSDILLLIGTSAVVYPAAAMPQLTKEKGGQVIEINPRNEFPFTDYFIGEKAGTALPNIIRELKALQAN
jgi:NAD-dependent deacetylase